MSGCELKVAEFMGIFRLLYLDDKKFSIVKKN